MFMHNKLKPFHLAREYSESPFADGTPYSKRVVTEINACKHMKQNSFENFFADACKYRLKER